MAIIDLQRRITEVGRIRTGMQVPAGNGTRPAKLDTFRFTSADRRRIEQIAQLYGGTVEPWKAPAGDQWEVISERTDLEVIIPPADLSFSQHYELWSAGGCQRRCDGATESLTEGPCRCDPENRECDIHTRLSVLLRDIPGLGVWRLDSQGWYAAQELLGALEVITIAAGAGALLPGRLRLDQRMVKRPDKNGKPQTLRFSVPVIDFEVSPGQVLLGGQGAQLAAAVADRPAPLTPAPLTPVPQIAAPVPTIAEQSQAPSPRSRRSNAQTEIPPSGRRRATATPTSAASPEPDRPAPTPLSYDEFKRRVLESGMPLERVAEAHSRRFPTGPATRDLDDEQRGRLWDELTWTPVLESPAAPTSSSEQPATPPAAESAGMTLDELTTALHTANTSFAFAEAKAEELYGERRLDRLDNGQRLAIARELDLLSPQEA